MATDVVVIHLFCNMAFDVLVILFFVFDMASDVLVIVGFLRALRFPLIIVIVCMISLLYFVLLHQFITLFMLEVGHVMRV